MTIRDFCADPSLMWGPWLSTWFHLQRNDIVDQNISLQEITAMWDATRR